MENDKTPGFSSPDYTQAELRIVAQLLDSVRQFLVAMTISHAARHSPEPGVWEWFTYETDPVFRVTETDFLVLTQLELVERLPNGVAGATPGDPRWALTKTGRNVAGAIQRHGDPTTRVDVKVMRFYKLAVLEKGQRWDQLVGMVLRAPNPQRARELASRARSRGLEDGIDDPIWLDATLSTCEEVPQDGPEAVILVDVLEG